MRQDNFRKCSWCHRFSEIFNQTDEQKLSHFWLKAVLNTILRMEKTNILQA